MTDLSISAGAMCDEIEGVTGDTTPAAALKHLNFAYNRVLAGVDPRDPDGAPHVWSFLRPRATLVLWKTATSTLAGAPVKDNGTSTVTAAEAIFHASMVGRDLAVTGGGTYEIVAYVSPTVVTVSGDASGESNGAAVTIAADGTCALPDDFGGMAGSFVWSPSASESPGDLEEVTPEEIDVLQRDDGAAGTPTRYAIQPRAIVTTGQRWQAVFHPTPDATRTVRYRYRRRAAALADSDAVYPLGAPEVHRAILCAGMIRAARSCGRSPDPYEPLYAEAMAAAIDHDRTAYGADDTDCNMSDVA